jgi:hypothetical protein
MELREDTFFTAKPSDRAIDTTSKEDAEKSFFNSFFEREV